MPRTGRVLLPHYPHHIVQRGHNRRIVFTARRDYERYLETLAEFKRAFGVKVYAWCLMTNHVHLLLTPGDEESISRMMQAQGRKYVQYFNFTHGRSGTLWEGRYKSTLVDADNYLLTVYRYIELNPVRANMVTHASEYPWSSYPGNALGKPIQLLTPHLLYRRLGKTAEERQTAYRALFRGRMPAQELAAIREASNKAWVLGDDRFKRQIEAKTGRRSMPAGRGGDRKSARYLESLNQ